MSVKSSTIWRTGSSASTGAVVDTESSLDLITEDNNSLIIESSTFTPEETSQWTVTQTAIGVIEDETPEWILDESGNPVGDETFFLSRNAPQKWLPGFPGQSLGSLLDTENSLDLLTEDSLSLVIDDVSYTPNPTDMWTQIPKVDSKWNSGTPSLTTNSVIDTESSLDLITESGNSLVIEDLTLIGKLPDIWS